MPSTLTRLRLPHTCLHTGTNNTRELLRRLLRETAQSVAVVTACLPIPDPARHSSSSRSTLTSTPAYHGATLSSFTSIALDPLPLVAFSLRVPSRMASTLNSHIAPASAPPPSAHLVINVLSAAQPHLADRFARPDLHPRPFQDPHVHYTLSQDGLPILAGALGALSCHLVGPSLPLAHLHRSCAFVDGSAGIGVGRAEMGEGLGEGKVQQVSGGTGLASELFIARVLRVEHVSFVGDDEQDRTGLHRLPLVYHRRRYTTVKDLASS